MFERSILSLHVIDPAGEEAPALRDRLKSQFPPGTARRMSTLGMMIGAAIKAVATEDIDTLVYSSAFGESISLEGYLRSFPTPSPTLFQTSIHPSGFQQGLILRQKPMREVIPIAGGPELVLQSILAAMTAPAEKVLWCGGEERGTWLREVGAAADRSFAFALTLGSPTAANALGKIKLIPDEGSGSLELASWFEFLVRRQTWQGPVGGGWRLTLDWT